MAALFPMFMATSFALKNLNHAALYELRVRTDSSIMSRADSLSLSIPEQVGTEWAAGPEKDDIAHALPQVPAHVVHYDTC